MPTCTIILPTNRLYLTPCYIGLKLCVTMRVLKMSWRSHATFRENKIQPERENSFSSASTLEGCAGKKWFSCRSVPALWPYNYKLLQNTVPVRSPYPVSCGDDLGLKTLDMYNSPGQALWLPGGWGSQILRQSAHEVGKVFSRMCWLPVPPRTIVWPEQLCQWNIPMTPSGIKPATFQFVAQCLNQQCHRIPRNSMDSLLILGQENTTGTSASDSQRSQQ